MTPDPIETRLAALADALAAELGDQASIAIEESEIGRCVELIPRNTSALPVLWWDFGSQLQVEAGHHGGWWELERELQDVEFIEDVARSVVAGRVEEVFGPGRSRVEVTLGDGSVESDTFYEAPRGCIPLPGWVRRGRRVRYAPYSQ